MAMVGPGDVGRRKDSRVPEVLRPGPVTRRSMLAASGREAHGSPAGDSSARADSGASDGVRELAARGRAAHGWDVHEVLRMRGEPRPEEAGNGRLPARGGRPADARRGGDARAGGAHAGAERHVRVASDRGVSRSAVQGAAGRARASGARADAAASVRARADFPARAMGAMPFCAMNRGLWLGQVPLVERPWERGPQLSAPRRRLGQLNCCVAQGPGGGQVQRCFDTGTGQCVLTWISPEGNYPGVPPCDAEGMAPGCAAAPPTGQPVAPAAPPAPGEACPQGQLVIEGLCRRGAIACPSGPGYDLVDMDTGEIFANVPLVRAQAFGIHIVNSDDPRCVASRAPAPLPPSTAALPAEPAAAPEAPPTTPPPPAAPPPVSFPVENLAPAFPGAPFQPVPAAPLPARAAMPAAAPPVPLPCPAGPVPAAQWAQGCAMSKFFR